MVGPLPSYKLKLVLGVVLCPCLERSPTRKRASGGEGGIRNQHGAKDVEAWKKLLVDRELLVEEAGGSSRTHLDPFRLKVGTIPDVTQINPL